MSRIRQAKIDMFEALPVPFGLVRYGVAPDHPEVKNCQDKFTEVATSSAFQFIGNVTIGRDISLGDMQKCYNAIVFAYGAAHDKKLNIPGESDGQGIHSARDIVGWYNGHPGLVNMPIDLTRSESAVVIGQGNVALDVARILLTDVDKLRATDISQQALAELARSKIKHVSIIGRRGLFQAAFTIKELRELINLPGVDFQPIESGRLPDPSLPMKRTTKRLAQLLANASQRPRGGDNTRSCSLENMLAPQQFILDRDSHLLKSVELGHMEYVDPNQEFEANAQVRPLARDTSRNLDTSVAIRSVGYVSEPVDGMSELGIDFDYRRSIITNDGDGRALKKDSSDTCDGETLPGLYCAGWVKRGPTGVIANTMEDSFATANAVVSDHDKSQRFLDGYGGWHRLKSMSQTLSSRPTSWQDWLRIDAVEKSRGVASGRCRDKITDVAEMCAISFG